MLEWTSSNAVGTTINTGVFCNNAVLNSSFWVYLHSAVHSNWVNPGIYRSRWWCQLWLVIGKVYVGRIFFFFWLSNIRLRLWFLTYLAPKPFPSLPQTSKPGHYCLCTLARHLPSSEVHLTGIATWGGCWPESLFHPSFPPHGSTRELLSGLSLRPVCYYSSSSMRSILHLPLLSPL